MKSSINDSSHNTTTNSSESGRGLNESYYSLPFIEPFPILGKLSHESLNSNSQNPEIGLPSTHFENETSMEMTDEWICLSSDTNFIETSSNPYHEVLDHSGVEDNDESYFSHKNSTGTKLGHESHGSHLTCNRHWDGLLCWPETSAGSEATQSCFPQFNGIHYDTSRNVSRFCEEGGVWQNVTDYTSCVPITTTSSQVPDEGLGVTIHVYFFGYCLSLTALLIAMVIFLSFKKSHVRILKNIYLCHCHKQGRIGHVCSLNSRMCTLIVSTLTFVQLWIEGKLVALITLKPGYNLTSL